MESAGGQITVGAPAPFPNLSLHSATITRSRISVARSVLYGFTWWIAFNIFSSTSETSKPQITFKRSAHEAYQYRPMPSRFSRPTEFDPNVG